MRSGRFGSILAAMRSDERIEVVLELDGLSPIQGAISAPPSYAGAFYGWMELAGALEQARRGAAAARMELGATGAGMGDAAAMDGAGASPAPPS